MVNYGLGNMTDIEYMKKALGLALKARGKTSPNPIVGAVVVKSGRIIGEGFHRRRGADHAEVVALKNAGKNASGGQLYVTLEPCFHYGRTPPCVDRIIESGIHEVIISMKDPNPLTNGKSINKLKKAGIKVRCGIMRGEAEKINEVFIKYVTCKMPFVVTKSAQSIDGKIATVTGQSKWITSEKTRLYARRMRDEFDAILVGINTILKDNPGLNGSRKTKRIKKIILDSSLRIPLKAGIFYETEPSDCFVATTSKAPASKIKFLRNKGINVLVCPKKGKRIHLKWLYKELAKMGIMSILIEGGSLVIGSALREGLVDKMIFYIAPMIIGSQDALSSISSQSILNISKAVRLKDLSLSKINEEILITGYVFRNS